MFFWKLFEIKPTQDEVAANPSCMNGCIYQEVGNPSSYACFVDAYNEVGCSVDVHEQSKYFIFFLEVFLKAALLQMPGY